MKLTMLGTGNAMVTECYNTCFLLSESNNHFLVDAGGGNGILHQLKQVGCDLDDIRHIFVSHRHIDHLLGILWLLRAVCQRINRKKYEGDVYFYGHDEVIALLHLLSAQFFSKKDQKHFGTRIHFVEVQDGQTLNIIGHEITFFDIRSTKAKQYGFRMDLGEGKTLACCGDEPYAEHEKQYVQGCNWLLHEAFCLFSQADIYHPYEKFHSTVKDACERAEFLSVQNLVLFHTEDDNLKNRKALYSAEGAPCYHGNLFIPDDLETIEL